jgi:hypothetical protein
MPDLLPKILLLGLAIAAVLWAISFVRMAVRTVRTGEPFRMRGHARAAFPVAAEFGPVGAVVISGVIVAIAVAVVLTAAMVWGVGWR